MGAQDRSREILQLISEGFVLVDTGFTVLEMNAEGERIDGRPAAKIVGRSLWDSWPNVKDGQLGHLLREAMHDRRPVSFEHLYTWPDGRQAWIETRAYPSRDGLAIFFRDVSSQRETEEELRRTQSELIHASRMSAMGAMAATLAHELSQPLTVVGNYVNSARRLLQAVPAAQARDARQALGFAATSTERATELLKRLRAFVAKGRTETETHDIQTIVADASVLVLPHAQSEGVEIQFRLDRFAKWVKADAVQIQQVLINLIKNAIEAMRGAELRRVTISTGLSPDGQIEVAVEDTGAGLDEDIRRELFTPFSSGKDKGLGVGLSISRTIVEAHGGTIEGAPRDGGGAVFRFTLPRATPPA
ncbi:ATP-binding protein [Sphingosinicella sp. LHD-64]|uniref:sensor histidine kinase n=1 Tax=Sphingosinicella sp. LHD-64 TaxID=3072139 RepID=UPI00280CB279|nr:ATP-binding protein [Sphingosinicella sp. LHD-64]MDQ8755136.1 ATP-binding protein [Sphingosinicella sp. LHD-64]